MMAVTTSSAPEGSGRVVVGWTISFFLAAATLVGWLGDPIAANADPVVIAIIWFNITVTLAALAVEIGRRPYSLHVMHLVAIFLFMGAASLFQYSRGVLGVPGPIGLLQRQILPASLATSLWLMGYLLTYELRRAIGQSPEGRFLSRPLVYSRVMILNALAVVGLVYLASAGLLGATTRGAAESAVAEYSLQSGAGAYSRTVYILTTNLARALPPMALLAALFLLADKRRRRSASIYLVVAVIGLGTLLVNNPFAASRMFLTGSLIAFSAPFLLIRFKTAWLLVVGISIGLAILPGLGNSRNSIDFSDALMFLQLMSPFEYLGSSSDVDSLGMTALCQQWIDQFGHTWGRQILGAMVSFIPRAIWTTKPIGTGAMVTGDLGFEFTNLSPPITAEALIDFGLPGTLVFGAVFGLILSRIDGIYWKPGLAASDKRYRIIDVLYPFLLVCITFFTRGDLFAATTFTESYVLWILPLGFALRTRNPAATIVADPNDSTP
jgi:oligosaccharide repeat unit polymerase